MSLVYERENCGDVAMVFSIGPFLSKITRKVQKLTLLSIPLLSELYGNVPIHEGFLNNNNGSYSHVYISLAVNMTTIKIVKNISFKAYCTILGIFPATCDVVKI